MVDASCDALITERLIAERYAKRMGLYLGGMQVQEHKWWTHFGACMRMPRGGVNGTGSQACTFEFSVPGDAVLHRLVETLPLKQRQVWDRGVWAPSKSIDTYYALCVSSVDKYLQLHRRQALLHLDGFYRGSRLITPPAHRGPKSVLLSVIPPLLLEVCHRTGNRIEVVVTFKLFVYNDLNGITMPPHFTYVTGMDAIFKKRAMAHIKAMHRRDCVMTDAFVALVGGVDPGSDSDEPWEESEPTPVRWTRPRRSLVRSPPDRGSNSDASDSASDAALDEHLQAVGEQQRQSHLQSFPRGAHCPTTPS